MARREKYRRYSDEFKARAVKLSQVKGVLSKDVAEALDIHPIMLLRWRSEYQKGLISMKGEKVELEAGEVAEFKRLREVERAYQLLKEEHDLLKKVIQFDLERKKKSLRL